MTTPDVSIVVPSRAGAQRLPVLLRALAAQTNPSWEAIVVLDGDIDESELVFKDFKDLPVRTITFPENRGRVSALNAGFAEARGRIFARCDDDLEPSPHYVARIIERHRDSEVGVVGLYLNILTHTAYARAYGHSTDLLFRRSAYASNPDRTWRYWAGNCSTTRQVWDRVGPYDTGYRAYGWEDIDWGFRLHKEGVPIVLAPELETVHHAAAQSVTIRANRAFHSGAARRIFEAKHGQDSLPSAIPNDHSPWNFLVRSVAKLNKEPLLQLADSLDPKLEALPTEIGRKLVALTVEAAAVSGYRNPGQGQSDF